MCVYGMKMIFIPQLVERKHYDQKERRIIRSKHIIEGSIGMPNKKAKQRKMDRRKRRESIKKWKREQKKLKKQRKAYGINR